MMRLILFIGLIAAALWIRHWWRTTPPAQVRSVLSAILLWGGIGLLGLALISGHLNPLLAAIATVGLALTRLERVLELIPKLRQLFQPTTQQQSPPSNNGHLSDAEARAILGVAADADAETIRAAHRRLMQRLHPDRGGSDHLAAQINAAKKRLLGD
jgi:hypothetical protein